MTNNRHNGIFYGVDGWTVLLYVLIVAAGWISITSASYDDSAADLLSFSHFYMKQLMWIGMAWVTAIIVLLLDERFYHMFAYPAYLGGIALLVAALLFGREVNGAKAWFEFGSLRVQPVEFAKIATALALARVMSEYSFSINRAGDLMKVAVVICIPLFIIILQNDTGSGIVLGSFLFVLYREGLNKWLCIPVLLIAALFIVSFLLSPMTLLVTLILVCTLSEAMMNGQWRSRLVFLAAVMLSAILLCLVMALIAPGTLDLYHSLLTTTLAAVVFAAVYAYRSNLANIFITLGLFVGSLIFLPTTDYIFNSILKQHQRDRILSFLGIISDPLGTDYNVNQAKIAIGSGNFWGKGFLEGTQIKYGFVPEKHTDFIFCTVGEEWGFLGSVVVLTLLCLLIPNRAVSAVAAILLMFGLIVVGSVFYNALCEPEMASAAVMTANGFEVGEPEPNPNYVSGALRTVYQFIVDALPTGQAILLANQELAHPAVSLCASVGIVLLSGAVGMAIFKRKDLK